MKKIQLIVFITCCYICMCQAAFAQQKQGWVTISGRLTGIENQITVEDISEFQYLLPENADRLIVPDSNGLFSIKFKAGKPGYYRLGVNILYLTPGNDLVIERDASDNSITKFKGKDAEACRYLINTPAPKGGSFLYAGMMMGKTPAETIAMIDSSARERYRELSLTKGITPEFRRLENARIKADIINSLVCGEIYGVRNYDDRGRPHILKTADSLNYLKAYRKVSLPKIAEQSKGFLDASLLQLVVYRDIAAGLLKQSGNAADKRIIRDWLDCDSLISVIRKVNDKNKLNGFGKVIARIQTTAYRNAVNDYVAQLMKFGNGDTAVDFTAINTEGEAVKLSSLKGKVIYIDFWATWCGPCMQEMPFYEQLKEKYKDNPDIAFVSLSIESTEDPWRKNIAKRKATGNQWLISRYRLQAYNIVDIPRVLLIDKNFKLVQMNGPRPSDKKTIAVLDMLSAKK